MSQQPDLAALNAARVRDKFIHFITLGRAVESCERAAIPLDHDTLHQMAEKFRSRPMTETELWVLERLTR